MIQIRNFHPELFQGSLTRKHYFEGWYFKHVSADLNQVWAFIPGIALHPENRHAFIQIIDGMNGKTDYLEYPLDHFSWGKNAFWVQIGRSRFSREEIELDIDHSGRRIRGKLMYQNPTPYPSRLWAPGIMGWYSFVPKMECYHGVISINHGLEGSLEIDGQSIDFSNGKGYIEKDWGRSFPECWIWLQSNSFQDPSQSLFFSVAKIPWLGRFFIGFIAFFHHNNTLYRFSTYNQSKITSVRRTRNELQIVMENRDHILDITVLQKVSGILRAPLKGDMSRLIKESIDSEIKLTLTHKKTGHVLRAESPRAGLEIIEEIFRYL